MIPEKLKTLESVRTLMTEPIRAESIRGVLPIAHTPFRDDDSIDFESLRRQIDLLAVWRRLPTGGSPSAAVPAELVSKLPLA